MASTKARTQQDVLDMTAAERLWDSMNYTYGTKREDIAKQFEQAYSKADNQLLSRGMQRSSYGAQTLANLQREGIRAQEDNWNTQIADYENRLQDIEQQEWQRGFQERQFNEGVRQYEQNFNYQQGRDAVTDSQWQQAFDQDKGNNDRSLAASYVKALIGKGQMPTDDLLARAGLSKEDAQRLLGLNGGAAAAATAGSSGPTKPKTNTTGDQQNGNQNKSPLDQLYGLFGAFGEGIQKGVQQFVPATVTTTNLNDDATRPSKYDTLKRRTAVPSRG